MNGLTLYGQFIIILLVLLIMDIGIVMVVIRMAKQRPSRVSDIKQEEKISIQENEQEESIEETAIEELIDLEIEEEDLRIDDIEIASELVEDAEIDKLLEEIENPVEKEIKPTVIRVQNVTMEFKVSTAQASGIKELLILKLKKKATFRRFNALENVSFDIQKGDVVGIIGSNGSGKSTILKIISGALMPTSGRVKVDKRKVQLLTLGTGFDMELTARENIYLNGAIIGYTREYVDRHFDEIIKFAELEDFVDEKLKNYSSGMVSRLGFAIATSGKAAEILILDEVLSVGDSYFRDKSMKRIQEMIHGGSTVIMVSHSADTIRNNCTRAIWIEKGKLMADGEPKQVCKMYEDMQNEKKVLLAQ